MPDPYERHGRVSGWDAWGPNPSRHQQRAAAAADDVTKPPPAKKDRDLCKAAHWKGPHQPELRIHPQLHYRHSKCQWSVNWGGTEPWWSCAHEEVCTGCGKILRVSIGNAECPDFRPVTEVQRLALERQVAERQARVAARRYAQRPVIKGPQGYRKPRENK